MILVFVSHAHRDKSFAELVVRFLESFGLGRDHVRCTSLPGYGLRLGEHVSTRLREEIAECRVVIGLLTENGLASRNVLLELGVGWGLGKTLIPVLGPGVDHADMLPWLSETHWMWWRDRPCWRQFEELFDDVMCLRVRSRRLLNTSISNLIAHDFGAAPAAGVDQRQDTSRHGRLTGKNRASRRT
jgi:hypothetical protein